MIEALYFNFILLLAVFILSFLFNMANASLDTWERMVNCIAVTWIVFCISALGWTIYVIAHFVTKYW